MQKQTLFVTHPVISIVPIVYSRAGSCKRKLLTTSGKVELTVPRLRRLEKGSSFDNLTQQDIDLIVSHINSIARKSLNDEPAITLFEAIYGKTVL
jgi:hypothetical protein